MNRHWRIDLMSVICRGLCRFITFHVTVYNVHKFGSSDLKKEIWSTYCLFSILAIAKEVKQYLMYRGLRYSVCCMYSYVRWLGRSKVYVSKCYPAWILGSHFAVIKLFSGMLLVWHYVAAYKYFDGVGQ